MKSQIILLLSVVLIAPAWGGVLRPDATVEGKTIGEWSAEWWQWAFLTPTNQHPLFDTTGAWATNGQPDSPVFFLAGIYAISGVAQRSFSVPEGKYLFVPVVNVAADPIGNDLTIEELRDDARVYINTWFELHASIDGVPVTNLLTHRAESPVFGVFYPDANNLSSWLAQRPIVGLLDPIVSDGYWLMVKPLPPGTHVINFGGTFGPPSNFILDITDTITVVPVPLAQKVEELRVKLAAGNLPAQRQRVLQASLVRAGASFENGKLRLGINHLQAFQHQVRAVLSRSDPDLARDLTSCAQAIIDRAIQNLPNGQRGNDKDAVMMIK